MRTGGTPILGSQHLNMGKSCVYIYIIIWDTWGRLCIVPVLVLNTFLSDARAATSLDHVVTEWLTGLHDNCVQAIPVRYLHDRLPNMGSRQDNTAAEDQPCLMQVTNNDAVTLQAVMLPDLLCTATTAIAPHQVIATLPLGHPWLRDGHGANMEV